jgi:hypothetical protein
MKKDTMPRAEPARSLLTPRARRAAPWLRGFRALPLVAALAWPAASMAVLPLLIALGHHIVRDMVMSQVKGQLIASLAGMGCKGARIASLVASASAVERGTGRLPVPAGIPGGAARWPGGERAGAPMGELGGLGGPGGSKGIGGFLGRLSGRGTSPAAGVVAGGVRQGEAGPVGLPGMEVGEDGRPSMAEAMAAMRRQHPGAGSGADLSPEQMEQAQGVLAEMQEVAAHPLSRAETIEVFDDLARLGVLSDPMHAEAVECILLAPLGSDQALGSTGSVMRALVLPRLRETREKLSNLTPDEQDQLAGGVEQALREASPVDRKAFLDGLGTGFFPPEVVEKVRERLR